MFICSNLDSAAESVKNIVDRIRCIVCDKTNGSRARYSCGHSACTECVDLAPNCLLCLTPPLVDQHNRPTLDDALTTRVKHVNELLQAFQETFQVDVSRRQRISEHLKKEKELFPECIQAVHTYHNKSKCKNTFNKTRRYKNRCFLPGEEVESPSSVKMNTLNNFVQDWLDQSKTEVIKFKPRKPFSDLEVNSPQSQNKHPKNRTDRIFDKLKKKELCIENETKKRSRSKTAPHVNKNDYVDNDPFEEMGSGWKSVKRLKKQKKCEKEDIGIFKDYEIFSIEDSQAPKIFKNKQIVESNVVKHDERDRNNSLFDLNLEKTAWKSVKRPRKEFKDCDKEILTKRESEIVKDETITIEDSQNYEIYKNKQTLGSGVVKDDEAIVIESSQDDEIEKDRQAWLAVLQAYENETPASTESNDDSLLICKEVVNYTNDIEVSAKKCLRNVDTKSSCASPHKVPFFKRSTLHDLCRACDIEEKQRIRSEHINNWSITVETERLITKITVSRLLTSRKACPKKDSKLIQTDGDLSHTHAHTDVAKTTVAEHQNYSKVLNDNVTSQDLFTGEAEANAFFESVVTPKENKATVVSESSSDSELEQSLSLVIAADVHESKDDKERIILGELHSEKRKQRSVARGYSPESSNSSDKENRDPNMMRKRRHPKDSKKKLALLAKKPRRF